MKELIYIVYMGLQFSVVDVMKDDEQGRCNTLAEGVGGIQGIRPKVLQVFW